MVLLPSCPSPSPPGCLSPDALVWQVMAPVCVLMQDCTEGNTRKYNISCFSMEQARLQSEATMIT